MVVSPPGGGECSVSNAWVGPTPGQGSLCGRGGHGWSTPSFASSPARQLIGNAASLELGLQGDPVLALVWRTRHCSPWVWGGWLRVRLGARVFKSLV